MKKKLFLFMSFILLLCQFSVVNAKGELGDNDAFKTYIGKTRSEVRRISPIFDELADDQYLVDCIIEDDELLGISVMFDDYNLVQAVSILVSKGALKKMGIDTDLETATFIGAINLGFESKDVLNIKISDDGEYVLSIKGGITVIGIEMSDNLYAIMGMQR